MELTNSFVVDAPVEQTWKVLTDLERVAPCLPGATLTGVDGEDFHGLVKIKVGPVTAAYEGIARFAERDDAAHAAVIRAEARESTGQGGAAADISARLTEHGDGTHVQLRTDLALSGRVAQFGRGVISDVSSKLIGTFADRLEQEITRDGATASAGSGAATETDADSTAPTTTAAPGAARSRTAAEPDDGGGLDVLTLLGPVLRRAAPAAGAAALALLTGLLLGRRGRGRTAGHGGPSAGSVTIQLVLPAIAQKENV